MKRYALFMLAALSSLSVAQSPLSTGTAANNGSGGIFMQLTGINSVTIRSFDTFVTTGTTTATIEVWTRPGAYAGFTASNVGWTMIGTGTVGASTSTVLINIDTPDFSVAASSTLSVYLHSVTTGRGIRYNGTAALPPITTVANSDLSMFSDAARTGIVPFGGTQNSPRTFAGNIHYTVVPEPGSIIALASGALIAIRRRRK